MLYCNKKKAVGTVIRNKQKSTLTCFIVQRQIILSVIIQNSTNHTDQPQNLNSDVTKVKIIRAISQILYIEIKIGQHIALSPLTSVKVGSEVKGRFSSYGRKLKTVYLNYKPIFN